MKWRRIIRSSLRDEQRQAARSASRAWMERWARRAPGGAAQAVPMHMQHAWAVCVGPALGRLLVDGGRENAGNWRRARAIVEFFSSRAGLKAGAAKSHA